MAVLPFVDMSPAKDQEYFCDGMAEELINALTQIPALRIVSRTSSFQFKDKVDDVRSIGQRLGVRTLLEGSVRTAGERMRIGARLTNVADGYQIWSSQYDREMKDIFAVQDEIAGAILAALRVTLIKADDKPIVRRQAGAPEAYKLYLKGRHEWNKRTEQGLMKSIEFFTRAIDEEPGYARAHAGLADAYVLLGIYGIRPPERGDAEGQGHRRPGPRGGRRPLGPGRGRHRPRRGLHDPGLRQRGLRLGLGRGGADLPAGHQARPQVPDRPPLVRGQLPRPPADASTRRCSELLLAQEYDPVSPAIQASLGLVHGFAGRQVEAAAALKETLEADPDFAMAYFFLGQTYLRMERIDDALGRPGQRQPPGPRVGGVPGRAGPRLRGGGQGRPGAPDPRGAGDSCARERYVSAALLAEVHAGLGETEKALSWLEEAEKEHSPELSWIGVRPAFGRCAPVRPSRRCSDGSDCRRSETGALTQPVMLRSAVPGVRRSISSARGNGRFFRLWPRTRAFRMTRRRVLRRRRGVTASRTREDSESRSAHGKAPARLAWKRSRRKPVASS